MQLIKYTIKSILNNIIFVTSLAFYFFLRLIQKATHHLRQITEDGNNGKSRGPEEGDIKDINQTKEPHEEHTNHIQEDFERDELASYVNRSSQDNEKYKQTVQRKNSINLNLPSIMFESRSMPCLHKDDELMKKVELNVRPSSLDISEMVEREENDMDNNQNIHRFVHRYALTSTTCCACNKKVKFGRSYKKCKICKATFHLECNPNKESKCSKVRRWRYGRLTLNSGNSLTLQDFVTTNDQVPILLRSCIAHIEAKGLKQEGLYRISGSDKQIKALKKKLLLRNPKVNLSNILDIHVVTGTVKDFLRSLDDPIIPKIFWNSVTKAASGFDISVLKTTIFRIPEPNLSCLKFFLNHLQKVVEEPENKMSRESLGKILAPTVIGYGSREPSALEMIQQTPLISTSMTTLLKVEFDHE